LRWTNLTLAGRSAVLAVFGTCPHTRTLCRKAGLLAASLRKGINWFALKPGIGQNERCSGSAKRKSELVTFSGWGNKAGIRACHKRWDNHPANVLRCLLPTRRKENYEYHLTTQMAFLFTIHRANENAFKKSCCNRSRENDYQSEKRSQFGRRTVYKRKVGPDSPCNTAW